MLHVVFLFPKTLMPFQNSVRHNLSLNKCFEKIENPNADGTNSRKGCLWALNPTKMKKMDEEVNKWNKKDPVAIKRAMNYPGLCSVLIIYQFIHFYLLYMFIQPFYLLYTCSFSLFTCCIHASSAFLPVVYMFIQPLSYRNVRCTVKWSRVAFI